MKTTNIHYSGWRTNNLIKRSKKILAAVAVSLSMYGVQAQGTCDYTENYSSNTGWTADYDVVNKFQGVWVNKASSGKLSFDFNAYGRQINRIYKNIGNVISTSNSWVTNFEFQPTNIDIGGPGHTILGLTAGSAFDTYNANATSTALSNQDAIAAFFMAFTNTNNSTDLILWGGGKKGSNAWQSSIQGAGGILLVMGTKYYVRLERLTASQGQISAFTDAAMTIHATNSPQCFDLDPTITGLNTMQHAVVPQSGVYRALIATVDNVCIRNVAPLVITGPTNVCSGTTSGYSINVPAGLGTVVWSAPSGSVISQTTGTSTNISFGSTGGVVTATVNRPFPLCAITYMVNVTVSNCCDYTEDYNTNTGWTVVLTGAAKQGETVSNGGNGLMEYNSDSKGQNFNRIWKSIGGVISVSNSWMANFEFTPTAVTSGGPGHALLALTSGGASDPWNSSITGNYSNIDAIAAYYASYNNSNTESTFILWGGGKKGSANFTTSPTGSTGINLKLNTKYYIRLERVSATQGQISAYTDAAMTIHATNSPKCFAIDPTVTGLNTMQHGVIPMAGATRSLTATLDNVCIRNVAVPVISGASTLCAGAQAVYSITVPPGATYIWTAPVGSTIATSTSASTSIKFGSTGGQISVTVTRSPFCPVTYTYNVNVNPLPIVTVSASSTTFCTGSAPVTLTANGALNYFWTPPMGLNKTTGSVVTAAPAIPTVYTVTGISSAGCTATASVLVNKGTYIASLTADFALSGTIPMGNTTTYIISASYPTLPPNCGEWWRVEELDNSGNPVANTTMDNDPAWWGKTTTTFPNYYSYQTGSGTNGVFLQGRTYRITRGVWGAAVPPLATDPCNPWQAVSKTIKMCTNCKTTGSMFVVVDDNTTPDYSEIAMNSANNYTTTGIRSIKDESTDMNVVPNPNNGKFNILINNNSTGKVSQLSIFDVVGNQLVEQQVIDNTSLEIDLTAYPKGMYLIRLNNETQNITKRVFVQ